MGEKKKQPTHIAGPTQTVCFEHQWAYLSRVNRKIKESSGQHHDTVAEPEIATLYIAAAKKDNATKWPYSQLLAPTSFLGIVNGASATTFASCFVHVRRVVVYSERKTRITSV